ncbi:hypothetical protein K438DRAFT_771503 [Mycena galopus ATCC 62051]|nr:hypothetical protein K438DRAFT_771503 [Mycena galopus ATCC 62051]
MIIHLARPPRTLFDRYAPRGVFCSVYNVHLSFSSLSIIPFFPSLSLVCNVTTASLSLFLSYIPTSPSSCLILVFFYLFM